MPVLGVFCAGMLLTFATLFVITSQQKQTSFSEFSNQVTIATAQLDSALDQYTTLVMATQALFHASEHVSRKEFHSFLELMTLKSLFPNTQALSWNAAIDSSDTKSFENLIQLDDSIRPGGYPEFTVRPETDQQQRYVITYIEPMEGNESAFGFDIGSNPDRRATVELARDTNSVAATAAITLAQESGSQKGFLMMLPVFNVDSYGEMLRTEGDFRGVVVAVFRIGDLISASSDLGFTSLTVFDVTDAPRTNASELLFSQLAPTVSADHPALIRTIDVANRQWELEFTPPEYVSTNTAGNWAIGIFGGLATILSAIFVDYILTSKQRVDRRANLLTIDLKRANEKLIRSNDDLAQFAYIASHDLQTPIRNVQMSADFLAEELNATSNSEVKEYLKIITKSSRKMQTLTSDLLSYAKLETNDIEKTEINLNTLLKSVETDLRNLCKQQNASLILNHLPNITGDEHQLERVFMNLVENAIKYAHHERPPVIEIDYSQTNDALTLLIKDNGMGIDDKYSERIFMPFRRLHSENSIRGSGLGLSICRKIIERHEGTINVTSSSSMGSVFSITLPRSG